MTRRISWALLGVAGVVILALVLRVDGLQDELADLRSELRAGNSVAVAPSGQILAAADSDSAESSRIENDLDGEWREASAELDESPPEAEWELIAAADENDENRLLGLSKDELRQVAMDVAEAQQEAMVVAEAQYEELYAILGLDEDSERAVRDIIVRGLFDSMLSRSRLRGDVDTFGERNRLAAEAAAEIDADLQAILTVDELSAWRDYDATFERRRLETEFLVMMVKLGTALPQASRDTVAVVLTDEWFTSGDAFADEIFNDANNASMMIRATESALDRLYGLLDENEFAHADEFIQTLVEQLEAEWPTNKEKSKSLA